MPLEAGAIGIRPINQPQRPGSSEGVQRREDGGSGSGFKPQTSVAIKTAIDDMAGVLSKIAANEKLNMERMPEEVSQVVKNILQQAFSMDSTLKQGIGSTLESQRFSMEQLSVFARMLTQIGALAEKGFSMELNEQTELVLKNLKALLVNEEGGSTFEPVLLSKAAFELIDSKTAEQLPQQLYTILAALAIGTSTQLSNPPGDETEAMEFLKKLIKFFMPRPANEMTAGADQSQQPQQGQMTRQAAQSQARQFLQSMFSNLKFKGSDQTQGQNPPQQSQVQGQNPPQAMNQNNFQAQQQPQQMNQPNQANQPQQFNNQSQPQAMNQNNFQPQQQMNQPNQANQPQQFNNQSQPQQTNQNNFQPQQPQQMNQPNQANQPQQFNNQQPQAMNQNNFQQQQPQQMNQLNQANQPQQFNNQSQPQAMNQNNFQQQQPQQMNQPNQPNQTNQPQQFNNQQPQAMNQNNFQQQQPQQMNQPNQPNQTNQPQQFNNQQPQAMNQNNYQPQQPQQMNQPNQPNQPQQFNNQSQPQQANQNNFQQQPQQMNQPNQPNQPQQFNNQSQPQQANQNNFQQQPQQMNQPNQPNQPQQFNNQSQPQAMNQNNFQPQQSQQMNQPNQTNQPQQFNNQQQPQTMNQNNFQPQQSQQMNQTNQANQPQQFNNQQQPQAMNQNNFQPQQQQMNQLNQTNQPQQFNNQSQPQQTNQNNYQQQQPQQMNQPNQSPNQNQMFDSQNLQAQQQQFSQKLQAQLDKLEQGDDFLAKQQQLKLDLQAAKTILLKQPMQNTPQTLNTMRDVAQFLMKNTELTPRDQETLQNFVNNKQEVLSEGEARHLQNLLRLCQQNVPITVQQAAIQQKLPDLPRLWAFMQLCDMASLTSKLSAKAFKRAGRDVAEFANAMRQSMGGENSATQNAAQSQRSLQMMMPLYIGDNENSYPTYLHVYDENEKDKETGEDKKETWLRICVLTDHIGAVELTFRMYESNQLDMRFYFSERAIANEFKTYIPAIKDKLKETTLNVGEVRIGSVGGRMESAEVDESLMQN